MSEEAIRRSANALAVKSFWLRLLSILLFIQAAITAITIIGLLVAWIPAWMGVALWKGADGVQSAANTGDALVLEQGLAQLGTYFTIMGVLLLIGLIGSVLMFGLFGLGMLGAMFAGF